MGVVDFGRKINTNVETTGFQSVVFGANGALLEVELNEMQALVNERLRKFLKSMFGDCCSQDALYVIDNNVFLNGTFIIDGYLFTNSDPIIVDISETNQLYLGYKIETITGADKVHKDGIGNEDEIDNTIIDTRVGIETSRREILSVKLVADGTSLPDDYNSFLLVDAGEPQIRSKNIDSVVTYCTEYVDKLVDSISTSIRNLTSKTDNLAEDVDGINSNLSKQLGSHTVKSDVPENAVFTDTVYDDTEVQKRISDNGYGEVAGGKNLVNLDYVTLLDKEANMSGISFSYVSPNCIKLNGTSTQNYSNCYMTLLQPIISKDGIFYPGRKIAISTSKGFIAVYYHTKDSTDWKFIGCYTSIPLTIDDNWGELIIRLAVKEIGETYNNDLAYIQIEESSVATEYEPYFPSNKMLAEENAQQNIEAMDLKMLGWSVPRECPIQNEVNGNQFIQNVDRIKISNLTIEDTFADEKCIRIEVPTNASKEWSNILYINGYISANPEDYSGWTNNRSDFSVGYLSTYEYVIVKDSSCGSKNGFESKLNEKYLYYKLETPITKTIDGNEEVVEVAEDVDTLKKETTVNLLNPTLQNTTQNGITCTNNGDGTYTLNGTSTSSSNTNFVIPFSSPFKGKCKLIGCPSDIDSIAELQCDYNGVWDSKNTDHGKGSILDSTNLLANIAIVILPNVTVNNLVFKPMITTNLNATYDDFVQYTGDSGRLNGDVAKLKNDLSKLQDNVDSSDIQYSAYIKNDNGYITPSAITSGPKINEVVSQINNNIGVLLQGHNEQKSKLDNISIDTIDRERGEITFKGIAFSAELKLLKIGNQLELLRGQIYTVGNFFSVTSGDVLSFALSVSEFGDYINGLKGTSKLAFSAQGIFDSKVIGVVEIGDYISSSGDKGVEVMLRFNDSYDFSSANVRSGTVQFDF